MLIMIEDDVQRGIYQSLETDYLLGVPWVPRAGRTLEGIDRDAEQEAVGGMAAKTTAAAAPPPHRASRGVKPPSKGPAADFSRRAGAMDSGVNRFGGSGVYDSFFGGLTEPAADEKLGALAGLTLPAPFDFTSAGSPHASLFFILDSPPNHPIGQRDPFSGRHGQLLNKQMRALKLSAEDYFISHLIKPAGRAGMMGFDGQGCLSYLLSQICIVRPRVIVTLGGGATNLLLGTQKAITMMRGHWQRLAGVPGLEEIPVMPTFHPGYLLKSYTLDNRKKVWEDLQQALSKRK